MKPIVFAAALNEGLVDPTEIIDCENGRWIHRRRSLEDYHPYAELSAADVLKKSSNIGTAKIALRMQEKTMYAYLQAFGFGAPTGMDLPGEERGILHPPHRWDSLTHSRMSIGHAVTVTCLQMAVAINVIANDGRRVNPYLVKEVRAKNGELLYMRQPDEGVQVITPLTARRMRHLMARITESGGTGRRARFDDYVVAGKTGTAEKIEAGGGYSKTRNRASFAGFFPAHNPALTIVVTVDEPTGDRRTGGVVAAPVFRDIARYAAGYLGIPPEGY
jgi:cell division protein FtsI/penicillin-binding protein 2